MVNIPIFRIFGLLMVMLATAEPAPAASPADDSSVFGEPGGGRVRVETRGGHKHWERPGIYWLPKDTTLLDFVRLAAPVDLPGGEMPGSVWIYVKHEDKLRGRFQLSRITAGTAPGNFVLEDGDFLQTIPAL